MKPAKNNHNICFLNESTVESQFNELFGQPQKVGKSGLYVFTVVKSGLYCNKKVVKNDQLWLIVVRLWLIVVDCG